MIPTSHLKFKFKIKIKKVITTDNHKSRPKAVIDVNDTDGINYIDDTNDIDATDEVNDPAGAGQGRVNKKLLFRPSRLPFHTYKPSLPHTHNLTTHKPSLTLTQLSQIPK